MKKIRESIVIDSYEISEPYKENGKKTVDIICNNETTETNQTIKLVFDEVKHGMQIIPDYKVDISKMLVKNVNFVVPTGDALYINGEVVTKDMAKVTTDANTNTDTYHFDKILYGAYDANAINRYSQIDLKPEILQEGTTINFDATAYHANLEFEEKIKANADNMITQFYVNAREKKGNNKELKAYFANDKKLQKKVDKYLKETEEVLDWPETKNADGVLERGKAAVIPEVLHPAGEKVLIIQRFVAEKQRPEHKGCGDQACAGQDIRRLFQKSVKIQQQQGHDGLDHKQNNSSSVHLHLRSQIKKRRTHPRSKNRNS